MAIKTGNVKIIVNETTWIENKGLRIRELLKSVTFFVSFIAGQLSTDAKKRLV